MRYIVNFSTGLASFEAARRTLEELFRARINPNVSILRDRRGGITQSLTLRQFREEIESGVHTPAPFEWGGCGCFAPSPQMRMDDLLLEVRRYSQENDRQGAKPQ